MALLLKLDCALVSPFSVGRAVAGSAVHVLHHARSSASQSYGLHSAHNSRQATASPTWRASYSFNALTAALQIYRAEHTLAASRGRLEHKGWQPPNRPWTKPNCDPTICGVSRASTLHQSSPAANIEWQLKQLRNLHLLQTSNHSPTGTIKDFCLSNCLVVVAPGRKACNARCTSADKAPFAGSWIKVLEETFGASREDMLCVVARCENPVWCGAHVMVDSDPDGRQVKLPMIGPMCRSHNHYLKYPADRPHELRVGAPLILIPLHTAWDAEAFMPHGVSYPGVGQTTVAITDSTALGTAKLGNRLAERLKEGPGVFAAAGLQSVGPGFDSRRWELFVQRLITPRG